MFPSNDAQLGPAVDPRASPQPFIKLQTGSHTDTASPAPVYILDHFLEKNFSNYPGFGNSTGKRRELTFWLIARKLIYDSSMGRRNTSALPPWPIRAVRPQRCTKALERHGAGTVTTWQLSRALASGHAADAPKMTPGATWLHGSVPTLPLTSVREELVIKYTHCRPESNLLDI